MYKRIITDVRNFKNTYPNIIIKQELNTITLDNELFHCIIELSEKYPFTEPIITVHHKETIYHKTMSDWSPIMDIRTIYEHLLMQFKKGEIDKDVSNPMFYVVDYHALLNLKEKYPNINIINEHHQFILCIDEIEIFIALNKIDVLENGKKWPGYMTPSYTKNVLSIVEQVIDNKTNLEKNKRNDLQLSLECYFDTVSYNAYHKIFMIDCKQGLIVINQSTITIYTNNIKTFELENKLDVDLGKFVYDMIQ